MFKERCILQPTSENRKRLPHTRDPDQNAKPDPADAAAFFMYKSSHTEAA
ncbi:MAG: hypothetical protein MSH32_11390 [Lachnospiraceae bacterium]|nr:hypothetical protein [Lachnospiraceae bacterium]